LGFGFCGPCSFILCSSLGLGFGFCLGLGIAREHRDTRCAILSAMVKNDGQAESLIGRGDKDGFFVASGDIIAIAAARSAGDIAASAMARSCKAAYEITEGAAYEGGWGFLRRHFR
jgi:hypothetical protein